MNYLIDGEIDLAAICEEAGWHHATCMDKLQEKGLSRQDAEAFAEFAFAERANTMGGVTDVEPEECVTVEQWNRLTVE